MVKTTEFLDKKQISSETHVGNEKNYQQKQLPMEHFRVELHLVFLFLFLQRNSFIDVCSTERRTVELQTKQNIDPTTLVFGKKKPTESLMILAPRHSMRGEMEQRRNN